MPRSRQMNPVEKIDRQIEELQREKEIVLKYFSNGRKTEIKPKRRSIPLVPTMQEMLKGKKGMSIEEIEEGLKKRGWVSTNKDPKKTIWAAIGRGKFKKVSPGVYGIK